MIAVRPNFPTHKKNDVKYFIRSLPKGDRLKLCNTRPPTQHKVHLLVIWGGQEESFRGGLHTPGNFAVQISIDPNKNRAIYFMLDAAAPHKQHRRRVFQTMAGFIKRTIPKFSCYSVTYEIYCEMAIWARSPVAFQFSSFGKTLYAICCISYVSNSNNTFRWAYKLRRDFG